MALYSSSTGVAAGLFIHSGSEALRSLHPAVLRILWWVLFPIFVLFIPVGVLAHRRALKLPEATGARLGAFGDSKDSPVRVLVIGESPVAGVGVKCFDESLPARLAAHLCSTGGRPVTWQALGWNGIRLAQLLERLKRQAMPKGDWVIWVGGVNDTTALTGLATWRRTLRELGLFVSQSGSGSPVFFEIPPMHLFAGIPQPLRFLFGLRAALLNAELAAVCRENGWLLLATDLAMAADFLAEDGYHPSARGCDQLGRALALALLKSSGASDLVWTHQRLLSPGPVIPED